LARLWHQRAARQEWFRTAAGSRVRVIYPGREGKVWGPDFRDALLEFEGQGLVRGDVELHVRQRDWKSHGHWKDPNYNGVVLHAALEVDSPSTGLQSGKDVPVVSLAPPLDAIEDDGPASPKIDTSADARISQDLWELLESRGYPRPGTAREAGDLLDRAGDQRFLAKSIFFSKLLEEEAPGQGQEDQVLFEALMEGLGYKANQAAFLCLAQRAPWRRLIDLSNDLPDSEMPFRVAGWLWAISGLAPSPLIHRNGPVETPPGGLGPSLCKGDWRLSGLRPANHPVRRVAGAAGLVSRFRERGLTLGLARACEAGGPKYLTEALTVPSIDHGPAYLGQDRPRDLAVNVALPFLHALEQAGGAGHFLEVYRAFAKLQENDLTKEMSRRLLSPGWRGVVDSARRQQGLIQLHRLLTG